MKKKFYNRFDPYRVQSEISLSFDENGFVSSTEILVDQTNKDSVDVNSIVKRFGLDTLAVQSQQLREQFGYADVSSCLGFAEMQQKVALGQELFNSLPAVERAKFNNNVVDYMNYIADSIVKENKNVSDSSLDLAIVDHNSVNTPTEQPSD